MTMPGCKCENWTLADLADALNGLHKDNKRIVIPIFQRGKRWNKEKENKFIDSLIKGYPVGTMLFYETHAYGGITYVLVDGLQRGNSIKAYMERPTEFFYDSSVSIEFCQALLKLLELEPSDSNATYIRSKLTNFIKEQTTYKDIQYFEPASEIAEHFGLPYKSVGKIINHISSFFKDRQALYDKIANTVIPVIVYTGEENNLPEIFDRINSQGVALDRYEVYAASWPGKDKIEIENKDIVEYVIRKYDAYIEDGFKIHDYNREELRETRRLSAFEYLFGLGKYLANKYPILGFGTNIADDTINTIGFELVDACLNETEKIKELYKNIVEIDVNKFEKALCSTIEYVDQTIKVVTNFKGNTHNKNRIFHSKFQILSMVSSCFKERFVPGSFEKETCTWAENKKLLQSNLSQYYVYDIISQYWYEGGNQKIYNVTNDRRYLNKINSTAWAAALDGFFQNSLMRNERKSVANPKSGEYVILNCIYSKTFTAADQLSIDRFDIEHIAPKDQMRKLIEATGFDGGLPISSIANLCYLPDHMNRSKKSKNFYQDSKYLKGVNLEEVEEKYSFTTEEDLEWMDMPYDKFEDFVVLKEYYLDFLARRFIRLKRLFCESMCIDYIDSSSIALPEVSEHEEVIIAPGAGTTTGDKSITAKCVQKMAVALNSELVKVGRTAYATPNKDVGFIVLYSKLYVQGQKEKYWFGYRLKPLENIKDCKKKYVLFACKDENTILQIPIEKLHENLDSLNTSVDDEGVITHWHLVFFKNQDGTASWLLSKPSLKEVDITTYLLDKQ